MSRVKKVRVVTTGQVTDHPGVEVSCLGDKKKKLGKLGSNFGKIWTLKLDFPLQAMDNLTDFQTGH